MNLKDRKVKSKLWIHSKRPDNPAIKRRKTNPTGTRTATRQISPGNPSQKTQEETETSRARKKNILYYHHRNEGKKETRMKAPMSGQASQSRTNEPTRFPEFRGTINDSFSSTCANTYQHSTSYIEISVLMTSLDCKSLLGNTRIMHWTQYALNLRTANRANPENESP